MMAAPLYNLTSLPTTLSTLPLSSVSPPSSPTSFLPLTPVFETWRGSGASRKSRRPSHCLLTQPSGGKFVLQSVSSEKKKTTGGARARFDQGGGVGAVPGQVGGGGQLL